MTNPNGTGPTGNVPPAGTTPAGTTPAGTTARPRLPWEATPGETPAASGPVPRPAGAEDKAGGTHYFQQVKSRVHRRLIERLNLSSLDRVGRDQDRKSVV